MKMLLWHVVVVKVQDIKSNLELDYEYFLICCETMSLNLFDLKK